MNKIILVTGCAGFIGMHLSLKLVKQGYRVIGIDNLNSYYSTKLKKNRLKNLLNCENFKFFKVDICDSKNLKELFKKNKIDYIIHLAAQAGVRYSLKNPSAYIRNNLNGFYNILEISKLYSIKCLLFASSSSVYGNSKSFPLNENQKTDEPLSLYAATKKSNEILAHSYSYLFNIPIIGLRFFTVYGPWGRPDMSLFIFTKAILKGQAIPLYNDGRMKRDFTYIDDIVTAICKIIKKKPFKKNQIKFQLFNIGNSNPVRLINYIKIIAKNLKKKVTYNNLPMQKGDVTKTFSDTRKLQKNIYFKPKTSIENGIKKFVSWYMDYYKIK